MYDLKLQANTGSGRSYGSRVIPFTQALEFATNYFDSFAPPRVNLPLNLTSRFFKQFLPNTFANEAPNQIWAHKHGENWFVLYWGNTHTFQDERGGYLFAYRENPESSWKPVKPLSYDKHTKWEVDPDSGDLTATCKGDKLFFPQGSEYWPSALMKIQDTKCYNNGLLHGLLEPDDENPLSMLLKLPQPTKGQHHKWLKSSKELLIKSNRANPTKTATTSSRSFLLSILFLATSYKL